VFADCCGCASAEVDVLALRECFKRALKRNNGETPGHKPVVTLGVVMREQEIV